MELVELSDVDLTYVTLESLDYDAGGQLYGTMEGSLTGERLSGTLRLTNLAGRRTDNVNLPTLRGVLDGQRTAHAGMTHPRVRGPATSFTRDVAGGTSARRGAGSA